MNALEKDYRLAHVGIARDYSFTHGLVNDIV